MTKFYIIWNPEGKTPPTMRFSSERVARKSAERLAKQNPGQNFYVMQAVAFCVADGFKWTEVETPEHLPF